MDDTIHKYNKWHPPYTMMLIKKLFILIIQPILMTFSLVAQRQRRGCGKIFWTAERRSRRNNFKQITNPLDRFFFDSAKIGLKTLPVGAFL